jgi:5-formyltetrahydrofolate cyclo-ligase
MSKYLMPVNKDKAYMREKVRAKRLAAFREDARGASQSLASHLTALLESQPVAKVAGYWAVGSEIDLSPLLGDLDGKGWSVALPVVVENDTPLIFRRWHSGDELLKGPLNILQPKLGCDEVIPDVILVPLLAFDDERFRLGQGGGFYDRTLEQLKSSKGGVMSIGIAFAAQRVNAVPRDKFDQRLDFIVTENGRV